MIAAAADAGFQSVGLRLVAPSHSDAFDSIIDDEASLRETERCLQSSGLCVLDVETLWLEPDTVIADFQPALETAARLGARFVQVVGNDPLKGRLIANVARLCQVVAPLRLQVMLEFIPYSEVKTLARAAEVIDATGESNAGVLIDALHLSRSGGSPAELATMAPALLPWAQICDAPRTAPAAERLRAEARRDRLYPGEGGLPLLELLAALPPDIPLSVEAPHARYRNLSARERARLAFAASSTLLRRREEGRSSS
ncbi:MAG TPA: TIM barrel protein [Vineibacter sp.]|nr:TIM barrel protein [Vineibacter sp.]